MMGRSYNFFMGVVIGMGISAVVVAYWYSDPPEPEFTVPYRVYPALTIKCDDTGTTNCDTLFTYRDFGK